MPKVVILSNFINHHILPFCEELNKQTNGHFNFVSRKNIASKRVSLGWKDISEDYDYVIKTYKNDEEVQRAMDVSFDADYVITGDADDKYIKKRLKEGKITFKDSEHIFKSQHNRFSWFRKFRRVYINHGKYMKYPIYLLCSSAYAANDFNKYFAYKGRTYKWGYFPETIEYDIDELIKQKNNDTISILWAGRLIKWKHPEYAIELGKRLFEENINFHISIIGNGEMEEELKELVNHYHINDRITFLGSMSPSNVRKEMEKSQIYLFTSNHDEGWGVVLNEAMNSGCACVASHAPGSTCHLIKNNKNGLIYKSEDFEDFYVKAKKLIINKEYREELGKNAYNTIINDFNAKVAVERFLELAKCLSEGKDTPFKEGLCSKSYPVSVDDMYKLISEEK